MCNVERKTVVFNTPAIVGGVEVNQIEMREPTVEDQLIADKITGGDAAKEVAIFANLCEVSPDDIKKLTLRNYRKLQEAFVFFTS